ncbi:MAG: MCE-family protein [Mycobacterium sp.]|nr:MCE-family protein [Mycobacterium sp.]
MRVRRYWHNPPYKAAGLVLSIVVVAVLALVYLQFRGDFTPKTQLTLISGRAGLVMDPGSKVTYNGVEIGRVAKITAASVGGTPNARLVLGVDPKYVPVIPANVVADIQASTVFGNKYVAFTSPENPATRPISSTDVIDVSSVTTEFNTLFETVTSIAEQVDPVKLNATLSATAEALAGLGTSFGDSIVNGNDILADLNPQLPQLRYDSRQLADLADVYSDASPQLWNFLDSAITTAGTLHEQQRDIDAVLLASVGFACTGSGIVERGGPSLVRGHADLVATSQLLDEYSPEFYCMLRNYAEVGKKAANSLGGNGYSLTGFGTLLGAPNPYIYPDNLPRVNAKGGPEGRPGCWQPITQDLWPAPFLVMDTGVSIAPYNHLELGQPILVEYVWGRQVGEYTINP